MLSMKKSRTMEKFLQFSILPYSIGIRTEIKYSAYLPEGKKKALYNILQIFCAPDPTGSTTYITKYPRQQEVKKAFLTYREIFL